MRKLGVLAVSASLFTILGVVTPGPTSAAGLLTCDAAASTRIEADAASGLHRWDIVGQGVCSTNSSTYLLDLTAVGTSDGLGLCTTSDVGDLDLEAEIALVSATTGHREVAIVTFGAPSTTYPVTTPFVATRDGRTVGVGTIFTRIFLACPPAGSPSTRIVMEIAL